jgi:hypothetical protein
MSDSHDFQTLLELKILSVDNMYELEELGGLVYQRELLTKKEIIERAKTSKNMLKAQRGQLCDPQASAGHRWV